MPQLVPMGKNAHCPLNSRPRVPQSWSWHFRQEEASCPCQELNSWSSSSQPSYCATWAIPAPNHNIVTVTAWSKQLRSLHHPPTMFCHLPSGWLTRSLQHSQERERMTGMALLQLGLAGSVRSGTYTPHQAADRESGSGSWALWLLIDILSMCMRPADGKLVDSEWQWSEKGDGAEELLTWGEV